MAFSWRRTRALAQKEVHHVLRDPFTLIVALGLPALLVVFFGYVIDFDVHDVRLLVADHDRTRASRQYLELFDSSQYFKLEAAPLGGDWLHDLESERAKAALILEPGFGDALGAGRPARVQLLLDGADNSTAGIIMNYITSIQTEALRRLANAPPDPVRLVTRFVYNPELSTRWFIVPGLGVVVIGFLSILLTALTVAREWETGSMELLLTTPARPLEIILGKLAPYLALVLISMTGIYLLARLQFGVPFRGNHATYILGCLLYLLPSLAQGIVLSVVTRQQVLAMMLSFITGLLPSFLLSGFVFPIESMPAFFQYFTAILAPRWFLEISRGIFLKGETLGELWLPFLMLLGLSVLLVNAALRAFKQDLER